MLSRHLAKSFLMILFGVFVFQKTQAQTSAFQTGLVNYQNKKYPEAQTSFQDALKDSPNDAAVLTNLGLTAYQLGQKSWAIAYFRRALTFDPSLPAPQQGLNFVFSQLEVKEIPHQIETYESIRDIFLLPAWKYSYFWILAALVFLFFWSLLRYLGQRKQSENEDLPYPPFPWIVVFSGFFSVIFLALALTKMYDLQIPRGTIIDDKVAVQSAPGEGQLSLFEIYGGFEVVIRSHSADWVQITYPGGLTGWIKKTSIYITSGEAPW